MEQNLISHAICVLNSLYKLTACKFYKPSVPNSTHSTPRHDTPLASMPPGPHKQHCGAPHHPPSHASSPRDAQEPAMEQGYHESLRGTNSPLNHPAQITKVMLSNAVKSNWTFHIGALPFKTKITGKFCVKNANYTANGFFPVFKFINTS